MRRKKVPSFWWDFNGDDEIIVESDNDKYPVVGIFKYDPNSGMEPTSQERACGFTGKIGCAEGAILEAEIMIADLVAGRLSSRAITDRFLKKRGK